MYLSLIFGFIPCILCNAMSYLMKSCGTSFLSIIILFLGNINILFGISNVLFASSPSYVACDQLVIKGHKGMQLAERNVII